MMDRALKERIIGAIILVLFVVLVVPVFLDGPANDGEMRSEHVPLPGQSGEENRTVILDRNRTEPVPEATLQSDSEPQAAVIERKPAAEQPATPSSPTGMWAVQLGSFENQQNAERLAADLRKQGFAAFLSQLAADSGKLHRVRIGPQKDRESAETMAG